MTWGFAFTPLPAPCARMAAGKPDFPAVTPFLSRCVAACPHRSGRGGGHLHRPSDGDICDRDGHREPLSGGGGVNQLPFQSPEASSLVKAVRDAPGDGGADVAASP